MKLVILAHPPNPNPTTNTHITMNALKIYIAVQLGMKKGGFSAAFYKNNNNKITKLDSLKSDKKRSLLN
jgi:hypothetical protein